MQNLMRREETLPGYITCSASEALLHLLRNPNFHRTSTNRQGTFFLKTRVTLSTLSLPVLVILHFIIFLTTKTNFPNILSSFRGSRLHYTHFLQRKPLLLSRPSQPVWFYQHIINLLQINHKKKTCSCVCVSGSYPGPHFMIHWNLRFCSNKNDVTFVPH